MDNMGVNENDELDSPIANLCACGGVLSFEGTTLVVAVTWHLDHDISRKDRKKFLKYRMEQFVEVFGSLPGVAGQTKMGKCGLSAQYVWPNVGIMWAELREKFISLFEIAEELGELDTLEGSFQIHLSGTFDLPGKGHGKANA
jgi:uncharacterized Fe-S cluster-containing radical SAM superfamily protein